jgi:hypothetical protein
MRDSLLKALGLASVMALSGCVFMVSHSYTYQAVDRRSPISATDYSTSFFHLTEPLVENLVVDLTHELEATCAGAPLLDVQTKVYERELLLVQIYTVRLSGVCGPAPQASARASL